MITALSALAGGVELLVWPYGTRNLPLELLDGTPFNTFMLPGLLLAVLVGGASLAAAALIMRRGRHAAEVTALAGATLVIWLAAEMALLRTPHLLHVVYGTMGLVLLATGLTACWRSRAPRLRWLIVVTAAEAIGFSIPIAVGILTVSASAWVAVPLILIAGACEGLILGTGQALAFPLPLRRSRFAALTALGAGLVWALALLLVATMPMLDGLAQVVLGAAAAIVGLGTIGAAQWLELRRVSSRASAWIVWTGLAWLAALPMSFLPSPLVDEATPAASAAVLWACAGLLMAHVMARITWLGVERLTPLPARTPEKGTSCRESSSSTPPPKVKPRRSPTSSPITSDTTAVRWSSATWISWRKTSRSTNSTV